ncbi:hypothetical protein B0H65DRAFT_451239 [Neurospora tetraspora]|uniref:Uncharacterized protein n=1 Tax=Neurospora tetraspora TaxID=94610 RepID=A0AAE0MW91_9PEZI|nr:hypothetical protein B0H65DRAFT_451239 [Neurospora tetraspora]
MIFTRQNQNEAQPSRVTRTLPEVQVHFFQHDLLRQSAARQHVFPETAGDAVQRHLSEVRDLRLVRVLIRRNGAGAGDDDAVAEAVSDAVAGGGYAEGREGVETELTWREQGEKERREEMVSGLARWSKDLVRRGVPTNWVREVVVGLAGRVERGAVDVNGEEEELEVVTSRVDDEEEGVDEGAVEGQIIEAMDSFARNIWGASRGVLGMARRGVGELLAQFRGEGEGEEEEWDLVEFPDQRGRGRWR